MKIPISNKNLLVGDILVLNKGDLVEADGFAIKSDKIGVDESDLFQGENKYKIQYKSSNFEFNKNKNEYICPFIFAGSYIIEGEGYLLVSALGKNIYKNGRLFYDLLNNNENEEFNNDIDEYEYYKEIGYYKMKIPLFSEKMASIGMFIFIFLGFISLTKKGALILMEEKFLLSFDFLYDIINELIFILIGSLFAVPNNLNMIDFISYLFNENIMRKNNINFKHKKYPELAFIDTLIILDKNNNDIFKDEKKEEISNIIKNIKNCGINVILITDKNFENAIFFGKEIGIIENEEFKSAKKIVNKYVNLNKNNSLCIEREAFNSLYGKVEKEKNSNGKERIKFSNIEYFKKSVSYLKILAKAKEDDKMIFINGLEQIGKKICLTGASIEDLKLLKIVNFSFGNNEDIDILKDNYSLTLLNNSLYLFWKAFKYSCNINYKINLYIDFFIITFSTSLIINAIGLFIFKDLPINKFLIIYLKIFIDLIVPNFISRGNNYKDLLSKNKKINKEENNSFLNIGFKILLRGIILLFIMTEGLNLLKMHNKIEYSIWNDENGFYATILLFILFSMMIIHLAIIFIKVKSSIKNIGTYLSFIFIIQFFVVLFEINILKASLLSHKDIIKCFSISFLVIPIDILSQIII